FLQAPERNLALVIKTSMDPMSAATAARNEVWAVDKDMAVFGVKTMSQIVSGSVSQRRFNLLLLSLFATIALLLASIGIYGVMSYSVAQRSHEIGIRMALGASRSDVVRIVVGQGMMLAMAGVGLGLVAAFGVTRMMASLLFGTSAVDPITFGGIAILLLT